MRTAVNLKKQFATLCVAVSLSSLFVSCEDEPKVGDPFELKKGVVVLNEGLFPSGTGTLTYWDQQSLKSQTCVFEAVNGRALGNIGTDVKQYGSKIYMVANMSSTIEVIDRKDGRSVGQIGIKDSQEVGRQPRSLAFSDGFAYVCSFDGTVSKIDTTSLSVVETCSVGRNPDGIAVVGSKLFVSNSGGLDPNYNYDNTVSVIDLNTFSETKKITVGSNPGMMHADSEGDLYVITRGVFGGEPKKMYIIDTNTEEVKAIKEDVQPEKFVIVGDWAYMYGIDYDESWNAVGSYFKYNVKEEKLYNESFVNAPSDLKTPYSIAVDPTSGEIYIGDCKDYQQTGDLYRFTSGGVFVSKHETGLNPGAILILK